MADTDYINFDNKKIAKTILLSVYIDFTQETKRRYGWELMPNQEFRKLNKDVDLEYYQIKKYAEDRLLDNLTELLREICKNDSIRISHNDTKYGSIELLLTIYGAYASIADFIETTRIIREFVDRHYSSNLNSTFGSYFYVNTTVLNSTPKTIGRNIESLAILSTIIISILTTATLYHFSFGFIKDVVANSITIAFSLAIIIEISKVLTSYNLVKLKVSRILDNKSWLVAVRIIAIALSSIFCVTEITNKNTSPNLAEFRQRKQIELRTEFAIDSTEIVSISDKIINSKTIEKDKIIIGANTISRNRVFDYTPQISEKKRLEMDIERQLKERQTNLGNRRRQLNSSIDTLMKPDFSISEANNEKVNSILKTVFNIKPDSEEYKSDYQLFVIISALLITLLLEIISIISIQNISYFFLRR